MKIQTEISIGELLDKASILKIKSEKISDINKKISIDKELIYLNKIISDLLKDYPLAEKRTQELVAINSKLWEIEDKIREKERDKTFDNEFIELARSVYYTNDQRFEIKNKINQESGSSFLEQKSYEKY